nr:macrophage migration inhibitory factor homolog [Ipomoea batatas]GMC96700.1 macrophage migration inhibitory factor homolog [Ipomoea batatas]
MPTLSLFTNVPVDAVVASDILKDATKAVAKIVGKPESYVMIVLNGSVPIAFAGTEAPAAYGELMSIGGLGPSVNGRLSSIIAEILQTKLSIDGSRFYIKFHDVQHFSSSAHLISSHYDSLVVESSCNPRATSTRVHHPSGPPNKSTVKRYSELLHRGKPRRPQRKRQQPIR